MQREEILFEGGGSVCKAFICGDVFKLDETRIVRFFCSFFYYYHSHTIIHFLEL